MITIRLETFSVIYPIVWKKPHDDWLSSSKDNSGQRFSFSQTCNNKFNSYESNWFINYGFNRVVNIEYKLNWVLVETVRNPFGDQWCLMWYWTTTTQLNIGTRFAFNRFVHTIIRMGHRSIKITRAGLSRKYSLYSFIHFRYMKLILLFTLAESKSNPFRSSSYINFC